MHLLAALYVLFGIAALRHAPLARAHAPEGEESQHQSGVAGGGSSGTDTTGHLRHAGSSHAGGTCTPSHCIPSPRRVSSDERRQLDLLETHHDVGRTIPGSLPRSEGFAGPEETPSRHASPARASPPDHSPGSSSPRGFSFRPTVPLAGLQAASDPPHSGGSGGSPTTTTTTTTTGGGHVGRKKSLGRSHLGGGGALNDPPPAPQHRELHPMARVWRKWHARRAAAERRASARHDWLHTLHARVLRLRPDSPQPLPPHAADAARRASLEGSAHSSISHHSPFLDASRSGSLPLTRGGAGAGAGAVDLARVLEQEHARERWSGSRMLRAAQARRRRRGVQRAWTVTSSPPPQEGLEPMRSAPLGRVEAEGRREEGGAGEAARGGETVRGARPRR